MLLSIVCRIDPLYFHCFSKSSVARGDRSGYLINEQLGVNVREKGPENNQGFDAATASFLGVFGSPKRKPLTDFRAVEIGVQGPTLSVRLNRRF
jgi:hypothetical protein